MGKIQEYNETQKLNNITCANYFVITILKKMINHITFEKRLYVELVN